MLLLVQKTGVTVYAFDGDVNLIFSQARHLFLRAFLLEPVAAEFAGVKLPGLFGRIDA
jgi:hypothetical protein